jgi:hypothetical protein
MVKSVQNRILSVRAGGWTEGSFAGLTSERFGRGFGNFRLQGCHLYRSFRFVPGSNFSLSSGILHNPHSGGRSDRWGLGRRTRRRCCQFSDRRCDLAGNGPVRSGGRKLGRFARRSPYWLRRRCCCPVFAGRGFVLEKMGTAHSCHHRNSYDRRRDAA